MFIKVIIIFVLLIGCAKQYSTINLLPMYGGIAKSEKLKKIDDKFIEQSSKQFGTRDSASKVYASFGWNYMKRNDLSTSMKRFNQAWLLDSANGEVYWGFANLYSITEEPFDSVMNFFQMANDFLGENERLKGDMASAYAEQAFDLKRSNNDDWKKYYDKSMSLYRSIKTREREDCDLFLSFWNIALEFNDKENVLFAKAIIDQIGVLPHNKSRYDSIVNKTKEIKYIE